MFFKKSLKIRSKEIEITVSQASMSGPHTTVFARGKNVRVLQIRQQDQRCIADVMVVWPVLETAATFTGALCSVRADCCLREPSVLNPEHVSGRVLGAAPPLPTRQGRAVFSSHLFAWCQGQPSDV